MWIAILLLWFIGIMINWNFVSCFSLRTILVVQATWKSCHQITFQKLYEYIYLYLVDVLIYIYLQLLTYPRILVLYFITWILQMNLIKLLTMMDGLNTPPRVYKMLLPVSEAYEVHINFHVTRKCLKINLKLMIQLFHN